MPEQLAGDAILWRRIEPNKLHKEGGLHRPQSAAFLPDSDGEICVHIAALTTLEGVSEAYPNAGIVAFPASLPALLGYTVFARPSLDDASHAVILPHGDWGSKKLRRLANAIIEGLGQDPWIRRNFQDE